MNIKDRICSLLLLTGLFMSCQMQDSSKSGYVSRKGTDIEQFNVFYREFHRDSLFQISRIEFPLPGINSDEMTVEDTIYYWKKNEWLMHHMVDTSLFARKTSISDTVVEEEITSKDPGVVIKRKFQNIKGKWYLVLYEDVNL